MRRCSRSVTLQVPLPQNTKKLVPSSLQSARASRLQLHKLSKSKETPMKLLSIHPTSKTCSVHKLRKTEDRETNKTQQFMIGHHNIADSSLASLLTSTVAPNPTGRASVSAGSNAQGWRNAPICRRAPVCQARTLPERLVPQSPVPHSPAHPLLTQTSHQPNPTLTFSRQPTTNHRLSKQRAAGRNGRRLHCMPQHASPAAAEDLHQ